MDLERGGDANPFRGSITVSRHDFGIDDVTGVLDVGSAFAPLPIASLELRDVDAHLTDGQCSRAEGLVKATIAGDIADLSLPAALSGNGRCEPRAVPLPLSSPAGKAALQHRPL